MSRAAGLTITIAGAPDTGKTTTAHLIAEALKEAGYTTVAVIDVPPVTDKDRWWDRFQKTRIRPVYIEIKVTE